MTIPHFWDFAGLFLSNAFFSKERKIKDRRKMKEETNNNNKNIINEIKINKIKLIIMKI